MTTGAIVGSAGRYDLHMHSRHSYDSLTSPRAIVRAARRAGLAGIAVTDHNSIAGGVETQALAPADLLVIVGSEVYTDIGDIVCLFLAREITSRDPIRVIEETHRQGGIAFLPHPLRGHPTIPDHVLDALDGYEVLNSRAGAFDLSASGVTNWRRLGGKATLANSDAHFQREVGRAYTTIVGPPTQENVREAILQGRVTGAGRTGSSYDFYSSQVIKMIKTRDLRMLVRLGRKALRRAFR